MTFNGPTYHEQTQTQTEGRTKKKRHGLAGAVIGGALTGGIGSVAGGIADHGMGKDKSTATTNSRTFNIEDPSRLSLVLKELSSNKEVTVVLSAYQKDFDQIRNLKIFPNDPAGTKQPKQNQRNVTPQSINKLEEELAKYKSLLEKQLISQADYEAKKKQLLGL